MPTPVQEPVVVRAAPSEEVIDLRVEGIRAMDTFGEEVPAATMRSEPSSLQSVSTLTYERYYGLVEKPFSLSTDPRFLFRSGSHAPVLHDLGAAIRRREGLIVLTGDIGTGKTTLCRAVLSQLDRKTFATFVPDPFVTREDLLKMMLIDFGVMSVDDLVSGRLKGASRPDLSYPLYEFLRSLEPLDAFAVLVIDEVQNLSLPLLEEIRILSDLEDGRKLLQVVLVGQPEFDTQLKLPRLRQIEQRVTVHCRLQPLGPDEVGGYVMHRLGRAGASADQVRFTNDAVAVVQAASGGVPRVINVLCDRALACGQYARTSRIDADLVHQAMRALGMNLPAVEPAAARSASAQPLHAVRPEIAPTDDSNASPLPTSGVRVGRPAAAATARPQGDDLLALLDLPAVDVTIASGRPAGADGTPRSRSATRRPIARRAPRRWRVTPELPPAAIGALTTLGLTTAATVAGYWWWLAPALTEAVVLPPISRPAAVVASLGPLVLKSPWPPFDATPPSAVTQAATADASAQPTPAESKTYWAVQAGAFSEVDRASAVVARLVSEGYAAFERDLGTSGGRRLRAALVGPFEQLDEAEAALTRIRSMPDFNASLIRRLP